MPRILIQRWIDRPLGLVSHGLVSGIQPCFGAILVFCQTYHRDRPSDFYMEQHREGREGDTHLNSITQLWCQRDFSRQGHFGDVRERNL